MPMRSRGGPPLNIADLRAQARRVLPRGLFEFVDRGTEDEHALRRNRSAWADIQLLQRVLVDVSARSVATRFFGREVAMPVAVAPTGAAGLLWFDGEIAVARAAQAQGIPFTLSTASIVSMERVAEACPGARLWFQLYMWPDRQMSYRLVERVAAAGYEALVVTVDGPVSPNREYNTRNGFGLPMRITRRNAVDVALHPAWFFRVFARYLLRAGIPMLENYPQELRVRLTQSAGQRVSLPKNDAVTWADLRELRKRWQGPLLVKGIVHPADAAAALDCGADGIVVSNHGGRILDAAPAPIRMLAPIVERINGRAEVYVDSGITRGSDLAKAVGLGATGAFVGRAPLWGASVAGEPGARMALRFLHEELDRVMGLTGATELAQLRTRVLAPPALQLPEAPAPGAEAVPPLSPPPAAAAMPAPPAAPRPAR